MAKRLKLVGNPEMSFIYNVSEHVGPAQPNQADDVELVQFLIVEVLKVPNANRRISAPPPAITRSFDLPTGFWIYELQHFLEAQAKQATVDGVVSPAHGTTISYAPGKFWLIGALNFSLKTSNPQVFDNLPNDARLSATLRAAIKP